MSWWRGNSRTVYPSSSPFHKQSSMTDPLSGFFRAVTIQSVVSAQVTVRGDWGARYPAYRHLKFGSLLAGERWIGVEGESPIRMHAGDFYLLTDGRPYYVASAPDTPLVDGAAAFATGGDPSGALEVGSGAISSMAIGGRFTFSNDDMAGQLRFLPALIHIRASEDTQGRLANLLAMLKEETQHAAPGATFALANVANLILVRILRIYAARIDIGPSWLCGSLDPAISAVLSLMHQKPQMRWTVQTLANHVGLSRSALADRFQQKVGQAPIAYLTQWRMLLARVALRQGQPIATLASEIGFGSAAAFGLAFKRETGLSPGRYRHHATSPNHPV